MKMKRMQVTLVLAIFLVSLCFALEPTGELGVPGCPWDQDAENWSILQPVQDSVSS